MKRATILHGDCLKVLPTLEANSVDTVITDPPYGLSFMGKAWDLGVPGAVFWREVLRVAKPGAFMFAFGGTRTFHRLTCAIEDAGWEIRDCMMWLYGTGFPKSLDVSKAIDRRRDDRADVLRVTRWIAEARDRAGLTNAEIDGAFNFNGMAAHWTSQASQPAVPTIEQVPTLLELLDQEPPEDIRRLLLHLNGRKGQPGADWWERDSTGKAGDRGGFTGIRLGTDSNDRRDIPASPLAQRFDGYGTALKPGWEPVVVAMKPMPGTFAENAEAYDLAGLHIDGGRIDFRGKAGTWGATQHTTPGNGGTMGGGWTRRPSRQASGRWPANVLLTHDARCNGACHPECPVAGLDAQSGVSVAGATVAARGTGGIWSSESNIPCGPQHGDSGGASRFFYTSKASRAERGAGNTHPTVKPLAILRYLCKLSRPPGGGVVLDPFMGSGSTLLAALAEGRRVVGIEKEEQYCNIARARIGEPVTIEQETKPSPALYQTSLFPAGAGRQ